MSRNWSGNENAYSEDPLVTENPYSRRLFVLGGLAAASTLTACQSDSKAGGKTTASAAPSSAAEKTAKQLTPADALARLKAGNARFAAGDAEHPHQDKEARESVSEHQHPFALVHGCVDSRVSPELVFDQGVGDVFVTRTAAAILDDTIVGSMEFAVGSPYETPVIVIMGHTRCGAVTATVDLLKANREHPQAPGELIDIVNEIAPVARKVPAQPDAAAYIDEVVRANTRSVAEALVRRSAIIREAVAKGRTQVVPAVYDLDTGKVSWLSGSS